MSVSLKISHAALEKGQQPALKTVRCQGEELRVGFTVVDVKRPILSASRLMDRGIDTHPSWQAASAPF